MIAFWIVAAPVLAMTTWYVTVSPMPGAAGFWVWLTVRDTAGAPTMNPTGFENRPGALQGPEATTYAVLDTVVAPHTTPTCPVIVKVRPVPGSRPSVPSSVSDGNDPLKPPVTNSRPRRTPAAPSRRPIGAPGALDQALAAGS